jgi:protein involved in polysaccharide export with SLBB domain
VVGETARGMRLKELGEKAGGLDYTTAGSAIQRIELGRQQDPALQNAIVRAQQQLRIQRWDP